MSISAKDVMNLRNLTGAGMMDCKKALAEADGDFDAAIELLRKKGQKVAGKRADRDAKEGAIFIADNEAGSEAYIIELNCETDFVAKNDDFQKMGQKFVDAAKANKPADLDALRTLKVDGDTIENHLTDAMGRIGEKIDISKYEVVKGEKVVSYVHPGSRIGVAVAFAGTNGADVEEVGKDVAMQITAMNPEAIDESQVSEEVKERELRIGREQALEEGKPANIVDRIAEGKLKKFYKESTLVNQDFVKDTSKSVGQYVTESLGKNAKISDFKRVQLGA
ncbi:MAG: translation elongation factor Ts [Bacteroidia bacterium]